MEHEYPMDAICKNCGRQYGLHLGLQCTRGLDKIPNSTFEPKTRVFDNGFTLKTKCKVGDIITVLNEIEAVPFIGKRVLYSDNDNYRTKNDPWNEGTLLGINQPSIDYSFIIRCGPSKYDTDDFHMIKLFPGSFETKPKVDPKLVEALKMSIKQWQIMYDTGKSKQAVYDFLKPPSSRINYLHCFLCDYVGITGDGGNAVDCKKCIKWDAYTDAKFCHNNRTPFTNWQNNNNDPARIKEVLNHLKSELVRLETLLD